MNIKEDLFYFAHPYDAPTIRGRQRNFELCCERTEGLIEAGINVFSPICHTHPIQIRSPVIIGKENPTGKDWLEFWLKIDKVIAKRCDGLILAPDWKNSEGCKREVKWFQDWNAPIWQFELIITKQKLPKYPLHYL